MSSPYTNKKVIILISASAGELDWIYPIIHYLNAKSFKITVVYLSRRAEISIKENVMLHDFINHRNVDVISCGGHFFELIDKYGYLLNRIKIKLNLPSVLNFLFSFLDKVFGTLYIHKICKNSGLNSSDKFLIFSEFSNLRRARDIWVKKKFINSIYLYHPHGTNVNLDLEHYSNIPQTPSYKGNEFLLLAHPGEYKEIGKTVGINSTDLRIVYFGHPKYSKEWLAQYKKKNIRNKDCNNKTIRILVISRGYGSFIDQKEYINLIDSVTKAASDIFDDYSIIVKKHPREVKSYWNEVAQNNSSIQITENHIMQVTGNVDFAISFWSSAALDCHLLGLPVIEFFNPNKSKKSVSQGVSNGNTAFRKLGVVLPANNKSELVKAIYEIKQNDYCQLPNHQHPFVDDMLKYSNEWKCEFNKILSLNDFLENEKSANKC